eukprot:snap_masked-scaffold_40-processed-gene-1.29-mRNA-1 protein AED:0.74 eAED:1.00 QI:0/0/0/0.12/1/1/8/0/811
MDYEVDTDEVQRQYILESEIISLIPLELQYESYQDKKYTVLQGSNDPYGHDTNSFFESIKTLRDETTQEICFNSMCIFMQGVSARSKLLFTVSILRLSECNLMQCRNFPNLILLMRNLEKLAIFDTHFNRNDLKFLLGAILKLSKLKLFKFHNKDISRLSDEEYSILEKILQNNNSLKHFEFFPGVNNVPYRHDQKIRNIVRENNLHLFFFISKKLFFAPRVQETKLYEFLRNKLVQYYDVGAKVEETRLLFLGDGRCGKTSTIKKLAHETVAKTISSTLLLDLKYIVDVEDWNKQDRNHTMRSRVKKSVLLLATENREDRFPRAQYNLSFENELVEDLSSDLDILKASFQEKDMEETLQYLQIYDFGGQESFYSIFPLFLSNCGVYAIVFNSSKLTENSSERLRFWCENILEHAPKSEIIFIGTHWKRAIKRNGERTYAKINKMLHSLFDSLSNDITLKTNFAESLLNRAQDTRTRILREKYGLTLKHMLSKRFLFFPVENSVTGDSPLHENLREGINRSVSWTVEEQSKSFLLAEILFIDNLQQQRNKILLVEFIILAEDAGFERIQTKRLLTAYTELGKILYFPRIKDVAKNLIVLSISWLASAIGKFIFDPNFHRFNYRLPSSMIVEFRQYTSEGILSLLLFEQILGNYEKKDRNFILTICLDMFILINYPHGNRTEKFFIVPTLLPENSYDQAGRLRQDPPLFNSYLTTTGYLSLSHFTIFLMIFLERDTSLESEVQPMLSRQLSRIIISSSMQFTIVWLQKQSSIGIAFHGDAKVKEFIKILKSVIRRYSSIVRNKPLKLNINVL